MLTRKTVIDSIHITRDGQVKVTLAIIVLDDDEEIATSYSYMDIDPGSKVEDQVVSINKELAETKKPPIEDFDLLKKVAEIVIEAEADVIKINAEKI